MEWYFVGAFVLSALFSIATVAALGFFAFRQWRLLKSEGDGSINQRILDELESLSLEVQLMRDRLPKPESSSSAERAPYSDSE